MTGDLSLDRLDALEPDPLKAAEDRLAEAGDYYELVYRDVTKGRRSPEEMMYATQGLDDAARALASLKARLAAEADDDLPY